MSTLKLLSAVLSLALVSSVAQADSNPAINVILKDGTKKLTLSEMKKTLKVQTGTVLNKVTKQEMKYEGFLMSDILEHAGFKGSPETKFLTRCADGYAPIITLARAKDVGLILVYKDKNAKKGNFNPVKMGEKMVDPAPFYLIGPTTESYDKYPWPFQLVAIEESK